MSSVVRDRAELERKIDEAGEKLIVIDFFANWCGPCKVISPKLEELAKQYAEKAAVFKVNVDDCEDIALDFNITSMPTFVFMRNKNVVDTFVGGNTEKLVQNMERHVSSYTEIGKPNAENEGEEEGNVSAQSGDVAAVKPKVRTTIVVEPQQPTASPITVNDTTLVPTAAKSVENSPDKN